MNAGRGPTSRILLFEVNCFLFSAKCPRWPSGLCEGWKQKNLLDVLVSFSLFGTGQSLAMWLVDSLSSMPKTEKNWPPWKNSPLWVLTQEHGTDLCLISFGGCMAPLYVNRNHDIISDTPFERGQIEISQMSNKTDWKSWNQVVSSRQLLLETLPDLWGAPWRRWPRHVLFCIDIYYLAR